MIGIVVWIICGLYAGMPYIEQPDNIWITVLIGIVFLILGPLGLLE